MKKLLRCCGRSSSKQAARQLTDDDCCWLTQSAAMPEMREAVTLKSLLTKHDRFPVQCFVKFLFPAPQPATSPHLALPLAPIPSQHTTDSPYVLCPWHQPLPCVTTHTHVFLMLQPWFGLLCVSVKQHRHTSQPPPPLAVHRAASAATNSVLSLTRSPRRFRVSVGAIGQHEIDQFPCGLQSHAIH